MTRGVKWLREATHLTDEDREKVMATVAECKEALPEDAKTVGIRCPSYIGEPNPIAVVDYGPGRRIYRAVYR